MQRNPASYPPLHPSVTPRIDPTVLATYCGLFSAVAYTASNICLRSVAHCDPIWVSCVKALPTVLIVGPWLLVRAARNQGLTPSWGLLGILAAAGLAGQIGGNVLFQWSLGIIGIALTVPLCLGSMILAGVVVGRWFLGETVTRQMVTATLVLVTAIAILSLGASAANQSFGVVEGTGQRVWVAVGVAAACFAGMTYCLLGTVIRWSAARGTPISTILTVICLTGLISLGLLTVVRLGPAAMLNTPRDDLFVMLSAGLFNAAAFLALTKALQQSGLVYVNALNASQTALAAVAGVVLFGEVTSVYLVLGILLTVVGLLMMKQGPRGADRPQPRTSPNGCAAASLRHSGSGPTGSPSPLKTRASHADRSPSPGSRPAMTSASRDRRALPPCDRSRK